MTTSGAPSEEENGPNTSPSEEANREAGNIEDDPLASSTTTSTDVGSDLKLDIYSLERLDNELIRLKLGATNNSSEAFDLGFRMAETSDPLAASDISLVDERNQLRHISYDKSDGRCLCSTLEGLIPPGETAELWVAYPAPPEEVETMTVLTPITPPMIDIPISESSDSIDAGSLGEPKILALTAISDSLGEDQTGRSENSEEVSIILSSDVLFETNSSSLNDEATEILEQVAQEINDASSPTISVDGYADNTGNDSINIPLSQERAERVESTLSDLITREGVGFEVEGHGSADPIADNETEEGRERNRRVSVTFEK